MRDTIWAGKPQKLVMDDGTPKGAELILQERGVSNRTLKLDDMRVILANYEDFRTEQNALTKLVHSKRTVCAYSIQSLRQNLPYSLDSIPTETISAYIQKSRNYMFAYLGGNRPGTEMEKIVKKFSKEYKSHRRVSLND